MFGCECFCWVRRFDSVSPEPVPFSLPSPVPQWPEGGGFSKGRISLGELEVINVTKFEHVWSCSLPNGKKKGASFFRPTEIPDDFFSLGHYAQPNSQHFRCLFLVARDIGASKQETKHNFHFTEKLPALQKPINYTLLWSTNDWTGDNHDGFGYFWLPCPPDGYKAMGCVVTNKPSKPSLEEVRCVRADLTATCETHDMILQTNSFQVWSTRPCRRGMWEKGLSLGTFVCSSVSSFGDETSVACLKNLDSDFHAMPNINQIHALINQYGPTVFFHPDEIYLPSSVPWFFKNGAMLYQACNLIGKAIDANGSNLPKGGENDKEYWIDLPNDNRESYVKLGNIESAKLYVHVKPALGGTFTDIAMWVFCPFNGPGTLKVGMMSFPFKKVGQHVGDWEHFTLRVNNLTGELWSIYFSQHRGGEWVDACDLEYIDGNKAIVYSSKSGHSSFPHPGIYLQGSQKLGIGLSDDAARSNLSVDSSTNYQIVAAEYLRDGSIVEPPWLQYMREWGPTIVYNSRSELEKILSLLPIFIRFSLENLFDHFPTELYGEEGPTGPKEKDNWEGDERC